MHLKGIAYSFCLLVVCTSIVESGNDWMHLVKRLLRTSSHTGSTQSRDTDLVLRTINEEYGDINQGVIKILQDITGKSKIKASDELRKDLGMNDFDYIDMEVELEVEFDLWIFESHWKDFVTVKDVIDFVTEYAGNRRFD